MALALCSSGNVRVNFDLMTNIEGRNVLLVEDIVDSGRTLACSKCADA